jgi:mitochondrial fission protein ELM1
MRSEAHETGEPGLAGRRAWIISDGVAGHLAITSGIADLLGLDAEIKPIAPRLIWRHLAPNGPADPRLLRPLLGQPLPDIVLGAGRQTVPVIRALKRAGAFTVIFQSPRASRNSADVIWVPAHDRLRGANVIVTPTPPNRFSAATLESLRRSLPAEIEALPRPRLALLLGGPGAGFRYDAKAIAEFAARLAGMAGVAGSVLITPSRRTPPALLQAADRATRDRPRLLWNGLGDNPYPFILAAADHFVVTADSVNMIGEACATGRPIHVFTPPGGRGKFHRYHRALRDHGATRAMADGGAGLADWSYEPLQAGAVVAAEIEARWRFFQQEALDS